MNSQLYSLAYISKNLIKSTANATHDETHDEIRNILKVAHQNNPEKGITGALLFSGGYFGQVLEGPKKILQDLIEVIQLDKRHTNVTVLHFSPIKYRVFEGWAMAFAGIEDTSHFDIEGILASTNELKMKDAGLNLLNILENLVKRHQNALNSA